MASIKLTGDTSGVITVSAPAASGTNTITLPASTGTMALTSNIPGAEIPSQSGNSGKFLTTNGSAASWGAVASGGMTLLSTVATTSGTEVVAGSLTLTGYQSLMIYASDVGVTAGASLFRWKETGGTYSTIAYTNTTSSVPVYTVLNHNLITGVTGINPNSYTATNTAANQTLTAGSAGSGTNTGIDQATTSITFSTVAGQTFNRGQILIYGLK